MLSKVPLHPCLSQVGGRRLREEAGVAPYELGRLSVEGSLSARIHVDVR